MANWLGETHRGKRAWFLTIFSLFLVLSSCAQGTPQATPPPTAVIPTPAPAVQVKPEPSPTTGTPAGTLTPAPIPAPTTSATSRPAGFIQPEAVNSLVVSFSSADFSIKAYQAWPKGGGPFPGLIVIHENRGLTEHIKDVTRRFANQGYVALGMDLLSRVGGREALPNDDAAVSAINGLSREGIAQDLNAAFNYLQGLPLVRKQRIGVIGYCWGGGQSLFFATRNKELAAGVVYYGPNPSALEDVANIAAPILGIYGEQDTRITVNVPKLAETMARHNKAFEYKIYPQAAHAFFNDTSERYNAEASRDAWSLTVAFLEKNLK